MRKTGFGNAAAIVVGIAAAMTAASSHAADLSDPLVARGKVLFEEEAGGSGCAICHGMEATGDPDAGAPYIRGVLRSAFDAALDGAVPVMEYLQPTPKERDALYAYLDYLYISEASTVAPEAFPGKVIFEETAGGVGCQSCHGMDARGDYGPNIQGRSADEIRDALGRVEDMGFIELTDQEIEEVSTYLSYLLEAAG